MVNYDDRLKKQYALLEKRAGDTIDETDAEAFKQHANAYDPGKRRQKPPVKGDGQQDKMWSTSTVKGRLQHLQQVALNADRPIVELTGEEINEVMDSWHGELAAGTLRQRQLAVRKLIWHASRDSDLPDVSADPEDIFIDEQPDPSVDKADVLNWDDIEALRDACRNSRDRAFLEMLIYTGQRITALATLRLKDVYPGKGNGTFRLNPEFTNSGLKGAEGSRPLLGSVAYVRNWINNGHPEPDNPDAYLFTSLPQYSANPDVEKTLPDSTLRSMLHRLEERADVSRPCNPHNFRHTFVTIAYKEYGLDKDYIKKLIGHDDGSTVMETTYRHLDDDDMIEETEIAFGIREEDADSPFTPSVCSTCGAGLSPSAKACEACGTMYTPDAKAVKDEIEGDTYESAKIAGAKDLEEELDLFRKYVEENPGLFDELS